MRLKELKFGLCLPHGSETDETGIHFFGNKALVNSDSFRNDM